MKWISTLSSSVTSRVGHPLVLNPALPKVQPSNNSSLSCHPVKIRSGFTLVEILVALAISAVVMTGIALLFVGTVRAVRQGYMNLEMFELARGAMTVVEDDLVVAIAQLDYDHPYTFYGCPIGMTFLAIDTKATDSNTGLARVTYVIYRNPNPDVFEAALEDELRGDVPAFSYELLRKVETGVWDLATFSDSQHLPDGRTLNEYLDDEAAAALGANVDDEYRRLAKKCELWIRLLAGGDRQMQSQYDYWADVLGAEPRAYVLTENVFSTASPAVRLGDPFAGLHFFAYAYHDLDPDAPVDEDLMSPWWNDPYPHSKNWKKNEKILDVRLPGLVRVSLWLMRESPAPGAPRFKRMFTQKIDLPSGYSRNASAS